MSSIIKIQNLYYKDILNDVSFDLEENTFNVLIGPNSSGKTTLVKCILGLIDYNGQIIFDNEIVSKDNIKFIIKKIGVFAPFCDLQDNTVLYNLIYPLLNLKYSNKEAKKIVYDICDKFNISNLLFNNINDLSLMEKRLILFLSCIIHKPKFIIIDDSFEWLNKYYKKLVIDYLKKLKNTTILFITNNEEDLLFSDFALILNDGKIISNKKTSELLDDENLFLKNNVSLPFISSLSHKLKSYELIDRLILDSKEMVNEIWK